MSSVEPFLGIALSVLGVKNVPLIASGTTSKLCRSYHTRGDYDNYSRADRTEVGITLSTTATTTTSLNFRQQLSTTVVGTPTTTTLSINPLMELRVSKIRRGERPCCVTSSEDNDLDEIIKMVEAEDIV